jgi:uncharacterized protein YjbI with pentapeptide repeats
LAKATAKTGTQPPKLTITAPRNLVDGDAERLRPDDSREGERYSDADFTDYDLSGATFMECEFDSVTFTEAKLRGSRFVDSLITASFAPTFSAARGSWRDVMVQSPRWGSAELYDAELTSVHIRGGKIDYLNLRGARLTNELIEDCQIGELDLGGMRGDRVAVRGCRIGTLDLTRATSSSVDIRGSELAAVHGLDGLRGVTVDESQLALLAPLLAAHVGLIVE